jgi:hypothetical protein
MNRRLRAFLILVGVAFGAAILWITFQDLFWDTRSLVRGSSVIIVATPNYDNNPPVWTVDSILKGGNDPQFHWPLGKTFSSAPGHFSVSADHRPEALIVFFTPRFIFFGSLQVQTVAAVYTGKIPAFEMTQEAFAKLCSTK